MDSFGFRAAALPAAAFFVCREQPSNSVSNIGLSFQFRLTTILTLAQSLTEDQTAGSKKPQCESSIDPGHSAAIRHPRSGECAEIRSR